MANVALVTTDKTNIAATRTKAAIDSTGHTATLFNTSEVTNSNLSSFDAILTTRLETSGAIYDAALPRFRNYLNVQGIPILMGVMVGNASPSMAIGLAVDLKIISTYALTDAAPLSIWASNPHPLWINAGITPPQSVSVRAAADFQTSVNGAFPFVGEAIATISESNSNPTIILCEAGTNDLSGVSQFGARVGFVGFLYGRNDYSAQGKILLGKLIDWAFSRRVTILGSVRNESGTGLKRTVRAYVRSTGSLAGTTESSAVDGSFTMDVTRGDELHYVVALDELSGDQNAIVKDRIVPYIG